MGTVSTHRPPTDLGPPGHAEDAVLVARVRKGDLGAFEVLVVRYRDLAVRIAAGIVGRDEAEDAAQDAFLRALHRIESFRGDAPFRVWLMRIVTNTALNARARRRPVPVENQEETTASPEGEALSPASMLERSEARDRLAAKITTLRPEHQTVLVLRDLEGLSYGDIAVIAEVPVGTVKGRLHRARAEMAHLLRTNTYDWDLPDDGD